MTYGIYDMRRHRETGDWVVDGELGFATYPGEWERAKVREYYGKGLSANGQSFAH